MLTRLPFQRKIPWRRTLSTSSSRKHSSTSSSCSSIQILPSVQDALDHNRPVVALESTILAHGMPFPENLQLSQRLSKILRDQNVEPATIAVKNGVCRVGLTMEELEDLSRAGVQGRAVKCSTRELPLLVGRRYNNENNNIQWGATTVASTMTLAHLAGIATFCTGGIGGVHRGGEVSMDVSADLTELGRTPVIVISAGIKSILDISRTLEVLETNGVLTLAYQTDEFPAFFSPHSGIKAPARVDSAEEVAAAYWAARDLKLSHGISLAVPNYDPAGANVEEAIQAALLEAHEQGVTGQAVTPFILKQVAIKTAGDSLRSNIALVERNAQVSAEIAIAVCKAKESRQKKSASVFTGVGKFPTESRVVIVGGCVCDISCKPEAGRKLLLHTSNPAICIEADGGVGRNVAEVLGRLGEAPLFFSAIGNDTRGRGLLERLENTMGVQVQQSVRLISSENTATYVAVNDGSGDLHTACADMSVFDHIVAPPDDLLKNTKALILDANPPLHVLRDSALRAKRFGLDVFFEPTSVPKASIVARDETLMACLTAAFPNASELIAMAADHDNDLSRRIPDGQMSNIAIDLLKELGKHVLVTMNQEKAVYLVVTLGDRGVLVGTRQPNSSVCDFQHFPVENRFATVFNTSGAGDSFCGAFVYAFLNDRSLAEAVRMGMKAATMSLECDNHTVSESLSPSTIL